MEYLAPYFFLLQKNRFMIHSYSLIKYNHFQLFTELRILSWGGTIAGCH